MLNNPCFIFHTVNYFTNNMLKCKYTPSQLKVKQVIVSKVWHLRSLSNIEVVENMLPPPSRLIQVGS